MYHNSSVKHRCLLKKYPLLTKNTFWKGFLCSCRTEAFDGNNAVQMKACELWKVVVQTKLVGFTFWDEINKVTMSTRFSHTTTLSMCKPAWFWRGKLDTTAILVRGFENMLLCQNKPRTKWQFWHFSINKDSVSSNKNNWATYTAKQE